MKLTKQQKRDLKRNEKSNNKPYSQTKLIHSRMLVEGSSIYKRQSEYPETCVLKNLPNNRFVRPSDKNIFNKVLSTSYKGFKLLSPNEFNDNYSNRFQSTLQELENIGCYRFDVTQPTGLGNKLAKTFVSRCLVGEAGLTYKYLGLRMFAYPWNENVTGSNPSLIEIGNLNQILINKTNQLIQEDHENVNKNNYGNCNYNITLINRCFPIGVLKMKDEPMFEKDKISVSWHADSSLEHYSSIAVYHFTKPTKNFVNKSQSLNNNSNNQQDESWQLALKVSLNAEGPNAQKMKPSANTTTTTNNSNNNTNTTISTNYKADSTSSHTNTNTTSTAPAIAIPLPSEFTYFLLDEFNHHHQHAVLAGKTDRYSSTHRVCRIDGHSYTSMQQKCIAALQVCLFI